jgi:hypothetical protein
MSEKRFNGLRIAYFTEWGPYQPSGVLRKLVGQVEAWRELGAEAKMFSLAARQPSAPALGFDSIGEVRGVLSAAAVSRWPSCRLGYFNKLASSHSVRNALREFRPDIIYYRQQGPWYPGLGRILSVAPTVMEINTDEAAENLLWGRLYARFYSALQSRVLGGASGFVAVTSELADRWRIFGKPVEVVPNGFWGPAPGPIPPSGNTTAAFAFIGTKFNCSEDWYGVDKILGLANALPSNAFQFVGLSAHDLLDHKVPANVSLHGPLDSAGIARVFARCDIGIGSMAFHRKNMLEACTLKVRDYLMHRMPVVFGYREAEDRLNRAPYMLQLPNEEGNVSRSVDAIRDFAAAWCNRRVDEELGFMSRQAIESRRLNFLAGFVK